MNFIQERGFHWLYLLRICAQIKRKHPRHKPLHLAGSDVVGQPHFLTNANEETRPRSLLASSINSSAYRSGLERLAPRKPTMITPCALSFRLSTVSDLLSGMDAF